MIHGVDHRTAASAAISVADFHLTTIVDKVFAVKTVDELTARFREHGPAGHPAAAGDLPAAARRRHAPDGRVALRGGPRRDADHLAARPCTRPSTTSRRWARSTLLDVGTGSVRVDPNVEHAHHHLVCTRCGNVRDVLVDVADLRVPAALPARLHGRRGRGRASAACATTVPATRSTPDRQSPINQATDTPRKEHRCPTSTAARPTTT